MVKVTRRTFLTQSTAGAAAIGVAAGALGGGIGVGAANSIASGTAAATVPAALPAPLMVYVTNAVSGELTFLMGTKEVTARDPALVSRLMKAVR